MINYLLDPIDERIIAEAKRKGAVLVTWDSCMPGGGPDAVLRALDEARSEGGSHDVEAPAGTRHSMSSEDLEALAAMARSTSNIHVGIARQIVGLQQATFVRTLRVRRRASWRYVAHECYRQWSAGLPRDFDKEWMPRSNQLMGLALCEVAAGIFQEDFTKPPWN